MDLSVWASPIITLIVASAAIFIARRDANRTMANLDEARQVLAEHKEIFERIEFVVFCQPGALKEIAKYADNNTQAELENLRGELSPDLIRWAQERRLARDIAPPWISLWSRLRNRGLSFPKM